MIMSIALRFIPILLEETDKIMKAQIARGADFETGNIVRRGHCHADALFLHLLSFLSPPGSLRLSGGCICLMRPAAVTGNIVRRAKALVPLLVPLFISAFRRANDLAMAMEARCYRGGEGRTKMKALVYQCGWRR